jgi:Tfp pilus assembly PilM family ATPase/Tfp pilus assembly protein PilN
MGAGTWGLDIASTGIKAVELTRTLRGYLVTQYAYLPIDQLNREQRREKELEGLRKVFPEGRKGKRNLILSTPSHRTMVHRLALPFEDRRRNQQVVKFEVEPLLPFPAEQAVVDFYAPKQKGNDNTALVFAVPKEELKEQLSLMQEAELDPEGLIGEAMALFWLVRNLGMDASGALLDLGHEKTTMIAWEGERLTLVRSIPIAGAPLSQVSGQPLGASPPEIANIAPSTLERLAGEVQRTLFSYESVAESHRVENIFLTGGGASLPGIEGILSAELKRPVAILDVEKRRPSLLRDVPPEYHNMLTVALGAAFWGTVGEAERINFRQEEFVSVRKARKMKTRMTLLICYAGILAILGIGAFSTNLYLQEKRYQYLRAEVRKEFLQAQPGIKNVVNELQQMKELVREEKARVDALGGMGDTNSPLEMIRELSALIEPKWKVRVTELVMEIEGVELSGEADSFDTVNQLKAKLDRSALYKDVQLKTAQASSLENIIEFKFQMKRGI